MFLVPSTFYAWSFLILWLILITTHGVITIAAIAQPALVRRRATKPDTPATTMVMPVYGLEPEFSQNLDQMFNQDYPRFEIALAFAREHDPALATARAIMAKRTDVRSALRIGEASQFPNLKVRNEFKCLEAATTDFICIVDSNVSLPPNTLRRSMLLMEESVGLVTVLPVAVRARGLVGHLDCAFMNGYSTRFLLAASAFRMDKVLGKCMLIRWSAEVRQEVFANFKRYASEDLAIYFAVRSSGLAASLADFTVENPVGERRWGELWNRYSRWAMYRRSYVPGLFAGEPLTNLVTTALAGGATGVTMGILPFWPILATLTYWLVCEASLHRYNRWSMQWHSPFFWLTRELILPFLWFRGLFNRPVLWRERRMPVKSDT
jgi:ceramide glucosyltransferase